MSRKFIDTNIFIEVFARKGKKSDKCKELLEENENLYTSQLVIAETEWVLRAGYEVEKKIIVRCIKKILSSQLEVENKRLLIQVLDFYETHNVDWTDCINLFSLKGKKISSVYSYDKGLDKFKWIKRLEP